MQKQSDETANRMTATADSDGAPTARTAAVRASLEEYVRNEGLFDLIPEHQRPSLFTFRRAIAFVWLGWLWLLVVFFVLSYRGLRGLPMALGGPIALFFGTLVLLAVYFALRQFRFQDVKLIPDAGLVGGVFLLGFPVLIAAFLGLYLKAWPVILWYTLLCVVGLGLVLLLQNQAYRLHLIWELVRSTWRALLRSIALLPMLVPVVLVVTVLSVFSQELWAVLGTVSLSRLVVGAALLSIPAVVLAALSLGQLTRAIVGEFPDQKRILSSAADTPFVRERLSRGLISNEEWAAAVAEVSWRDKAGLSSDLLPLILRRTKRWLALLLGLTSLALILVCTVYFSILFLALFRPTLVATWLELPLETFVVPVHAFGQPWQLHLPSMLVPTIKVSFLLSVFVAAVATVYCMTDEAFRHVFEGWLRERATSWLSVGAVYQCLASPSYEVWNYVVRDRRRGIANAVIVVPVGLQEPAIEEACTHMESRLQEYGNLVIVTAFEQNPDRPEYRLSVPGRRWQLLHNKNNGYRQFQAMHLEVDDVRDMHFLGLNSLAAGAVIADDWFGNTPDAVSFARRVWADDTGHALVLHPYASLSNNVLWLDAHVMKRLGASSQYRYVVRTWVSMARQHFPEVQVIGVDVYFRDTEDTLAHLFWGAQLGYVQYRDETMTKNRIEMPPSWGL